MPRSLKIPKEQILKNALQMLTRSGNAAITIQSVARELKSSTQPLSWQFGNMANFRIVLAESAFCNRSIFQNNWYLNGRMPDEHSKIET